MTDTSGNVMPSNLYIQSHESLTGYITISQCTRLNKSMKLRNHQMNGGKQTIVSTVKFICSQILNTLKNDGFKKTLARISNREDPDQTAFVRISDLGPCLPRPYLAGNECLKF